MTGISKRLLHHGFLHIVLIVGAVVFALPFLWLLSTASKEDREIYQEELTWLPELPRAIQVSPYVDRREYPDPQELSLPPRAAEDLDANLALVRKVMLDKAEQLPPLVRQTIDHDEMLAGVFQIASRRVPDALWQDHEGLETFLHRQISGEDVLAVHEQAHKRLALGRVILSGWSLEREFPYLDAPLSSYWSVDPPDAATLVDSQRAGEPIAEVRYDLQRTPRVRLSAVVPCEMPFESFKRVALSLVADRTWRDVHCALEFDGRRHEGANLAHLGHDRWHEWSLQPASEEDKRLKLKTWIRMDPVARAGDYFDEPGKIKLIFTLERTSWAKAVWNKLAHNYLGVFRMVPFWLYTWNSVLLVLLNVAATLLSCSLVAYAFARLRWPGREFCFVLLLSTLMIPPQVTMIPVFLIFAELGMYNTLQPLWLGSLFAGAFGVFLLRQFMRTIPRDLEDSARIDGCGYLGIYFHIILPLIRPALAAIAIFAFMGVWNDFMGPLIYLNDQRLFPLSLGLFALRVFVGQNFGLLLAASVLMTLPVVLVFFVAQRHFIQGITLTGMKE